MNIFFYDKHSQILFWRKVHIKCILFILCLSWSLAWNTFNLREFLVAFKKNKEKYSILEKRGKWSSIEFIFSWTIWHWVADLMPHHHGKPQEVLPTWMLFSTAITIRKFISIYHCSWKHRLWSHVSNCWSNGVYYSLSLYNIYIYIL